MSSAVGKTDSLVELIDMYPTLSELSGLETPEHVQGKSFVPVLKEPTSSIRDTAYSSYPARVNGKNTIGNSIRTEDFSVYRMVGRRQPRAFYSDKSQRGSGRDDRSEKRGRARGVIWQIEESSARSAQVELFLEKGSGRQVNRWGENDASGAPVFLPP